MKKIFLLFAVLLFIGSNTIFAQNIINLYKSWLNYQSLFPQASGSVYPDYENVTYPIFAAGFYWNSHSSGPSQVDGEYQIYLGNFFWGSHIGLGSQYDASYIIETVSFPFMPDLNCVFTSVGCTDSTSLDRHLFLADDNVLDNDSTAYEQFWNYSSHKLYLRAKGWFDEDLISTDQSTLVSAAFNGQLDGSKQLLPHTILKVTVQLRCGGTHDDSNPVLSSFNFLYDNTRGRLRWYPFFGDNIDHGYVLQSYDLLFIPELLIDPFGGHTYNEADNKNIFEYDSNGTVNYFPFGEIQNYPECTLNPFSYWPDSSDNFPGFAFPPPYSLITAPLRSGLGADLAGYGIQSGNYTPMPGLKHKYHIDKGIDLENINPVEKIIYNPSEADITANESEDLRFPSEYIFKTIRGQYPTVNEITAHNNADNGGPFADPRDVPVTTDVISEDSAYVTSGYYLKNGSKLTVEGCVYIFDATFDCQTGSQLVFENFPTNKNPDRFNILYSGGTVTKRAHDFYFQNYNETESILKFESDGAIDAGYNVTSTVAVGDYTVALGANVTFTSDDAVTLKHGFRAVPGSQFVASAVASVSVPNCTPPVFRLASYGSSNEDGENSEDLKIIAYPNPTSGIFRIQLRNSESNSEKEIYVTDMFGKQLMPVESNSRSRNLIDLSSHPEGVYFVKVIEGDRVAVSKIIKM